MPAEALIEETSYLDNNRRFGSYTDEDRCTSSDKMVF